MDHEAKTRAEFAAMRRAMLNGFRAHEPAYSAEELAALRAGVGVDCYTPEELAELIGRPPPSRPPIVTPSTG